MYFQTLLNSPAMKVGSLEHVLGMSLNSSLEEEGVFVYTHPKWPPNCLQNDRKSIAWNSLVHSDRNLGWEWLFNCNSSNEDRKPHTGNVTELFSWEGGNVCLHTSKMASKLPAKWQEICCLKLFSSQQQKPWKRMMFSTVTLQQWK